MQFYDWNDGLRRIYLIEYVLEHVIHISSPIINSCSLFPLHRIFYFKKRATNVSNLSPKIANNTWLLCVKLWFWDAPFRVTGFIEVVNGYLRLIFENITHFSNEITEIRQSLTVSCNRIYQMHPKKRLIWLMWIKKKLTCEMIWLTFTLNSVKLTWIFMCEFWFVYSVFITFVILHCRHISNEIAFT